MKAHRIPPRLVSACAAALVLAACERSADPRFPDGRAERAWPDLSHAPGPPGALAPLTDSEISHAVQARLERDPGVNATDIRVDTTQGVVVLSGSVPDILSRKRAVRIAEVVKGVRTVSDRLQLAWRKRPDSDLQLDVEQALLMNAATDAYEVDCRVDEGVVNLAGTVQSYQERHMAERVAEGIAGVRGVINELRVAYGTERSDVEIQADVESRLRWDTLVNDGLIEVTVRQGRVRLIGTVASAAERRRAASDAWVRGVIAVHSEDVRVSSSVTRRGLHQNKLVRWSDPQIGQAVQDGLSLDARTADAGLRVSVSRGIVLLRGSVASVSAKMAAEDLARHTLGVLRVDNELVVEPDRFVPDRELERNVRAALRRDPFLAGEQIQVGSVAGVVTLSGDIATAFGYAQATAVAAEIAGVRDVRNALTLPRGEWGYVYHPYYETYAPYVENWLYVPGTTQRSDALIASAIRDELSWSPFVDLANVEVKVSEGRATLSGVVGSYRERAAATRNAIEGGAIYVDNRLQVDSRR